ncbi:MAG: hypothetical protein ACI4NM_06155 [Bullifex sp.]
MFTYDLKEREKRNQAVYGPSRILRVVCALFATFISVGFLIAMSEDGWNMSYVFPLILALLAFLIALYRDEWIMDNDGKCFTCIWGLGPFVSRKSYPYDDIKRIELTHFVKGIHPGMEQKATLTHRPFCVLSIRMKGDEDEKHDLEIMSERASAGKLERLAPLMAAYTGLEYYVDRAREVKTDIKRVF